MENKKRILTYGLFCESVKGNNGMGFSYLILQYTKSGIKITLNDDGKDYLDITKDDDDDNVFEYFFEDVDPEFIFTNNIGKLIPGMGNLPGILDGYFVDGELKENKNSKLFYYKDHETKSFVKELFDKGSVVFDRLKK